MKQEFKDIACWKTNHYSQKYIDDRYKNVDLISSIHSKLRINSADSIKLKDVTRIVLSNLNGVNNDYRGVRDIDWKLYYWSTFEVNNRRGVNFGDLIIAAFKIRSHKFENWYELFTGVKRANFMQGRLTVGIKFDHGS